MNFDKEIKEHNYVVIEFRKQVFKSKPCVLIIRFLDWLIEKLKD